MKEAHKRSHHGHTGWPGIPRAMVLTVSFVLFPATGLVVTVVDGVDSTNLTPASGRQNHTTSPSARWARSSEAPPASTASRPTSVTIAKRPLGRGGMNWLYCCFYQREKRKIFRGGTGHENRRTARRANHP